MYYTPTKKGKKRKKDDTLQRLRNSKYKNNKRKYSNMRTGGFNSIQPFGNELKQSTVSQFAKVTTGPSANNIILNSIVKQVPSGSEQSARIGNKILVTKIYIKGFWHLPKSTQLSADFILPETATDFFDRGRAWLVLDTQCNGATADPNQVLKMVIPANNGGACFCDQFRNTEYTSRFKILATWEQALNNREIIFVGGDNALAVLGNMSIPFEKYIKCSIPITYKASTQKIGDLTENNIFLMAASERGIVQLFTTIRIRYED